MDLLLKSTVAVVIIVAILFVTYYALKNVNFGQQVTLVQAESLVLHDLQNSNPSAIINITNATPSQYSGSWHIVTSVVLNATSPCPSYYIYSFDYPKYGFVYRVENTYTQNCVIYGIIPGKGYVIGSYPVAITKSYLLNLSVVINYINRYGYKNAVVHANYYNSTVVSGTRYTNVWIVNYSSPNAGSSVYVMLSQLNGTAVTTYSQGR